MEERIGSVIGGISPQIPECLNPYCSGRKNRMYYMEKNLITTAIVLILIVVEERIGYKGKHPLSSIRRGVLILIVMEERIG